MATNNHGTNILLKQNQGNVLFEIPGHWYFEEIHIKLNTNGNQDGILQIWINDGGTNGDFSRQTPTLRAQYTNVPWGFTTGTAGIGVVWLENWTNAILSPSLGEQFWANIHVRTAAPCGFAI